MGKISFAFLLGFFFITTTQVQASIVEFQGTPTTFQGVAIYPTIKVAPTDSAGATLTLTGRGVRSKSVVFVPVKVYVAASYVGDVAAFRAKAQTDLLGAVQDQKVRIIQLTMLRSLSAGEIRSSFEDALDLNGVNVDAPEVQAIFAQFNFGLDAGSSAVIIAYPKDNGERIVLEAMGKSAESAGPTLALDFWKIWFGKGDAGILNLQKDLVGG